MEGLHKARGISNGGTTERVSSTTPRLIPPDEVRPGQHVQDGLALVGMQGATSPARIVVSSIRTCSFSKITR